MSLGVTIGAVNRVVGSNRKSNSRNKQKHTTTLQIYNEDPEIVKKQLIKMKFDEEQDFQDQFKKIDSKLK